jgi:hypothetical protein
MPAGVNPSYRVACSDLIRAEIVALADQLHEQGFSRKDLARALARLDDALGNRPHEAGEGHFHIGELRWLMSYAFSRPFGVDFAILEEERVVILRRVFAANRSDS